MCFAVSARDAERHVRRRIAAICHLRYTGRRAASIRQLRWGELDLDARTVEWRADADKIGYQHKNPLHAAAVEVLARGKAIADETGDVWIFPNLEKDSEPMTRNQACKLWRQIATAVGIKAGSRLGTHSFRRSFAGRLRDVPLSELKELGGWKSEKTVIGTYIQPDQDAQRAAIDRL